jgi:hypothetical protein
MPCDTGTCVETRRNQRFQPGDRLLVGTRSGNRVEAPGDDLLARLQRGDLLLLRRRLDPKQRRRGAGQRLGLGLQAQCAHDLRNAAARDAMEEIAHLREHQPRGEPGNDRGSRDRRKSKEQFCPDSEPATCCHR